MVVALLPEADWQAVPPMTLPSRVTEQLLPCRMLGSRRFTNPARLEKCPDYAALTTKQIGLHLKTVPNWSKRGEIILRMYQFEGFVQSIDFVNRIARKAQKINHHPDIDIRFNKVTLKLTTHDEGGITKKDFSLARQCDVVFARFLAS